MEKDWLETSGPHQIRIIAEHFKIYEHLFGSAYFVPRVALDIKFQSGDTDIPVFYGNQIKPRDAQQAPFVSYDPNFSMTHEPVDGSKTLWTLLMTNPDGHFEKENSEYVHWLM